MTDSNLIDLAGADLDSLLALAPVGRAPWSALDADDRETFVAAVGRFLNPARKYERNYYRYMWGSEFTEKRYAEVACSDACHAETAYTYGYHRGMTFEAMVAKPWKAVDAMLTYMS